jgi:glutamate synthase (NADPH/NADH) small chain
VPGGVLVYGIPEFRLPKQIVEREIEYIKSLGVEFKCNFVIGRTRRIDELFSEGYMAAFISTGAGLPQFIGVPGENFNGVYSANEFLTRINLMKAYKFPEYDTPVRAGRKVAVIGAGNVAMDSARAAVRLGAEEVTVVYRRSRAEMPARKEEIENAEEEGVKLLLLAAPVEFTGSPNGTLTNMKCIRMELGAPDASGRRRPVPLAGSDFTMETDTAIIAVGQSPNPLLTGTIQGIKTGPHGTIVADEKTCATNLPGIYAGGDIATGAATVIEAMGAGKRAAVAINEYVKTQGLRLE